MQFKVENGPLQEVLQDLVAIVPTKSTLQVLTNFLISLKGPDLQVTATDLDISMTTCLKVQGEKDGDLTVNARKLFEIVRELPQGSLAVEVTNNVMRISCEGFSCKLAGADVNDFPSPPAVESTLDFSLPAQAIRRLVGKTSFAVSQDGTRRSLNGILWDIRDKNMIMVATDGHKLGYSSCKHNIDSKAGKSIILAPKAMNHLVRLLPEKDEDKVVIRLGTTYATFTVGDSSLTSKLIEGPYPNYEQVIPKTNNKRASIDRGELIAAIRRVSILSSVKTHQVKFSLKKDVLELSSVNRDFGAEAKETVPVSYSADPMDIGFNASFFLDMLKLTESPRLRLSLNTPLSACLIHPEAEGKADDEYFFLLMPLRLMNER